MSHTQNALRYLMSVTKDDPRYTGSYDKFYALYTLTAAGTSIDSYVSTLSDALNDFDVDLVDRLRREQNPDLVWLVDQLYPPNVEASR